MILGIDIGNTTIGMCIFDEKNETIIHAKKIASITPADEFESSVIGVLTEINAKAEDIGRVVISCVVREIFDAMITAAHNVFHAEPLVVSGRINTGLNFDIENLQTLGADRIADAAYCAEHHALPAVIVDMGTATTISVVDAEKNFLGGIITTGIMTGYNALIGMTSQLPKVTVETSTPLIGKNTAQCIESGVVHCNAAMIDGMVDRITKELGVQPNLILTGGNALYVKPYITHSYEYDENLLQKGLLHLAKIN